MTTEAENEDMTKQLGDVLTRLEGRLDDMEKGDKPAFLEGKDSDDGDKKDDKKDMKKEATEEVEKSEEYSDVITSDYLNWMEDTLKSAGVTQEPQGPISMLSRSRTWALLQRS